MIDDRGRDTIAVYWRPGCPFCAGLFRGLDRVGLQVERVNIWDDESGRAFVRSVANGNETVPTVRVGDLALVNPRAIEVMREVADRLPHRLPDGYAPPRPGWFARLRLASGTRSGHPPDRHRGGS